MTVPPAPPASPLPPYPRIARAAERVARATRRLLHLARWPFALGVALVCATWPASPPRVPWSEGLRESYAPALTPMLGREWEALGLAGRGMRVGVIDAGFAGWRSDPMLRGLQVEGEVDFTLRPAGWAPSARPAAASTDDARAEEFRAEESRAEAAPSDDLTRDASDHGTRVLRALAGRSGGRVEGLAHGARYWLAKTDLPDTETRADETRTIAALRWLAGQGMDVINVSLGYIDFQDGGGYRREQLDGRTARISIALAEVLAAHPDLVVVVSAGNRGAREWRYIGFPGDVAEALTVGAVDPETGRRWRTSGVGPPWLSAPKPDVATWGTRGTSFTAPAVAGLVACLREAAPMLSRRELLALVRGAGSQAGDPDHEMGYGIPRTQALARRLAATGTASDSRPASMRPPAVVRPAPAESPAPRPGATATGSPAAARPSG